MSFGVAICLILWYDQLSLWFWKEIFLSHTSMNIEANAGPIILCLLIRKRSVYRNCWHDLCKNLSPGCDVWQYHFRIAFSWVSSRLTLSVTPVHFCDLVADRLRVGHALASLNMKSLLCIAFASSFFKSQWNETSMIIALPGHFHEIARHTNRAS